ncbi:MAG: YbhB/YbcL family Raf kinase inhibitor-like protein [Gemmatimonadaceae bacterium]
MERCAEDAVSFTVMLVDIEAAGGALTHWVLFDLPSMTRRLSTGVPAIETLPQLARARHAKTDASGKVGYAAPCPPPGPPHRYAFRIFALDRTLSLPTTAPAKPADVKKAMQGHIVGSAELLVSVVRK